MRAALLALALAACSYDHHYDAVDSWTDGKISISYVEVAGIDVGEGKTASFSVFLNNPIAAHDVAVSVDSEDPSRVVVETPTITFPVTSLRDFELVHVAIQQDDDAADELVYLDLAGPDIIPDKFMVRVHDDDTQAIVTDQPAIMVSEGSTAMLTVRLAAQPLSPVTVHATTSAPDQVKLFSPLVFTPTTWQDQQFVQIQSLPDSNTVSEDTTLELSAAGMATVTIPIHNIDSGP
jgi:hypothetical protein